MVAGVGQAVMGLMNTDPTSRIGSAGAAISALGEKISAGLPIIGGFITGLGKGTEAVAALMGVINETVTKYGEFSSEVAQAQAVAEIRQTMGDFRRAQEVGDDLAKFVIAQSEMQQKFEEVKVKLLQQLVPAVTAILEVINNIMSNNGVEVAITTLLAPLVALANAANVIKNIEEDARIPDVEDPTQALQNDEFEGSWIHSTRGLEVNR